MSGLINKVKEALHTGGDSSNNNTGTTQGHRKLHISVMTFWTFIGLTLTIYKTRVTTPVAPPAVA